MPPASYSISKDYIAFNVLNNYTFCYLASSYCSSIPKTVVHIEARFDKYLRQVGSGLRTNKVELISLTLST